MTTLPVTTVYHSKNLSKQNIDSRQRSTMVKTKTSTAMKKKKVAGRKKNNRGQNLLRWRMQQQQSKKPAEIHPDKDGSVLLSDADTPSRISEPCTFLSPATHTNEGKGKASNHEVQETVTPQFKFEQSFVEEDSFGFDHSKADSLMPYGIHQEDEEIEDASPKQQHPSPQQLCLTPVPQSSANKRSADDDEYDVFAAFISSEIRGLRHEANRKKLKCSIMRAVLKAIEDEDTVS